MKSASLFSAIKGLVSMGLEAQVQHDNDYIGSDGLRVCGLCGEKREDLVNFPNPTEEDPERMTPLKVARPCRCDRERELEELRAEQARRDMDTISKLRKASLMDERFREATFDNFEINKYNEKNFRLCKRYANEFDTMIEKNQGLLLWGDVGTGKTFAAACIANELLRKKVPVIMTSFVRLLAVIQSGEASDSSVLEKIKRAKLVVFDDLGAERGTEYALEKVYHIVDERYRQKLPSIFTTNLTLNDMDMETNPRYSRIYDRIFSSCYPLQFTGASWRRKEAGHRFAEMEKLFED